jgi:hypothetical protein
LPEQKILTHISVILSSSAVSVNAEHPLRMCFHSHFTSAAFGPETSEHQSPNITLIAALLFLHPLIPPDMTLLTVSRFVFSEKSIPESRRKIKKTGHFPKGRKALFSPSLSPFGHFSKEMLANRK